MEFAEVRHYQPGDDIRNIDWRVTARTQETYTKLFQEEKERPIYLLVDQRSPMFFGSKTQFKSVLAAKIAACIAWAAFNNRDKIGALIFNDGAQSDLRPKQGKHAIFRCFHELADYSTALFNEHKNSSAPSLDPSLGGSQSIAEMLQELQRVVRPGSLIFVISDFHDLNDNATKALSMLSRHNDIEFISISDPFEANLPKLGALALARGDKKVTINSRTSSFRARYQKQWLREQDRLTGICLKLGINLRNCSTHAPLLEQIQKIFH